MDIKEMTKEMTKDELRELDSNIHFFIKSIGDAANKALEAGDIEENDRLESLLCELIKIRTVVYSRIQNMIG